MLTCEIGLDNNQILWLGIKGGFVGWHAYLALGIFAPTLLSF